MVKRTADKGLYYYKKGMMDVARMQDKIRLTVGFDMDRESAERALRIVEWYLNDNPGTRIKDIWVRGETRNERKLMFVGDGY